MSRTVRFLAVVIVLVLFASSPHRATSQEAKKTTRKPARSPDVVYVPTPHDVVDKMLEMAQVKKGDVVLISAAGTEAIPLVKELYALCLAKGAAYVEYEFSVPEINRHFYATARKEQLAYFPQHKLDFMEKVTVYIGISASENSMVMAQANQGAMIAHSRVVRPIIDRRVKNTRWVVTRYPTQGAAQEARMSLEEYEDYLFSACCMDWHTESRKQEKLKRLMDRADRVRIKASDTDLSFSIKGMPAIKCDGRMNIPDGEVFTAPVKDSVKGHIVIEMLEQIKAALAAGIARGVVLMDADYGRDGHLRWPLLMRDLPHQRNTRPGRDARRGRKNIVDASTGDLHEAN